MRKSLLSTWSFFFLLVVGTDLGVVHTCSSPLLLEGLSDWTHLYPSGALCARGGKLLSFSPK